MFRFYQVNTVELVAAKKEYSGTGTVSGWGYLQYGKTIPALLLTGFYKTKIIYRIYYNTKKEQEEFLLKPDREFKSI